MADPFSKPLNYDKAMEHMLANPGMSWERAEAESYGLIEADNRGREAARKAAAPQPAPSIAEQATRYARQHGTSVELATILVKQRPAGSRYMPAHHEDAIQYMKDQFDDDAGVVKYEDAVKIVRNGGRSGRTGGDLLAKAMEAPPEHEAATAYMMANPGVQYEQACRHVLGG